MRQKKKQKCWNAFDKNKYIDSYSYIPENELKSVRRRMKRGKKKLWNIIKINLILHFWVILEENKIFSTQSIYYYEESEKEICWKKNGFSFEILNKKSNFNQICFNGNRNSQSVQRSCSDKHFAY